MNDNPAPTDEEIVEAMAIACEKDHRGRIPRRYMRLALAAARPLIEAQVLADRGKTFNPSPGDSDA